MRVILRIAEVLTRDGWEDGFVFHGAGETRGAESGGAERGGGPSGLGHGRWSCLCDKKADLGFGGEVRAGRVHLAPAARRGD